MAQQQLSLIISAIDRATGPINKIRNSINGLGGGADKATKQAGGLSNAIAFGMVKAQAAIGAVTMGYNALTGALRDSANSELEIMNAASGIAALAGMEFDQASKFVDKFESKLSKTVEKLPGATSSYITLSRAISDNVATAFQDASGKITDMDKYAEGLERMSSAAGFLGASANLPQELTNLAISNALGGQSEKELSTLAFFQRNPAVMAGLDRTLDGYAKKLGKAEIELKDLDPASRFKVLLETFEGLAGPEQQQRAGNSVKGIFEGLRSSLFDAKGGLFGLERDLDDALDGTQNAYQRYASLIGSIFGVGGVLETLAKPLERLGFTRGGARDPMKILADGFEWLDERAKSLNKWLEKAQASISTELTLDNVGQQLSRFFNFLQGRMLSMLQNGSFDQLGEMIASVINAVSGAIVSAITGIDSGTSATLLGTAFTVIIREFADALAGLSWQGWAVIGAAVLGPGIIGAIATMAAGFAAPFLAAVAGAPVILGVAALASIVVLGRIIQTRFDEISAIVGSFFADMAQTFAGGAQLAIGILTGNVGLIHQGMQNLVDGVLGWVNGIRDNWAILTGGQTTGEARASAALSQADQRIVDAGGRINADGSVTGPIPNGANGYFPNAVGGFMGFLGAIARERRAMPAGANLLVANTSETVLTREQAGAVGGAISGGGGKVSITNNFTISGANNPESLAAEVMRLMQIQLDEHLQGSLI